MALINPQLEHHPRGGADTWDQGAAGLILTQEVLETPSGLSVIGELVLASGLLSALVAPAGGDLKVYLNTGLLYAKAAPAGGDLLVSLYDNGLFQAA